MYYIKDNVDVNFGVIKQYQVAERIGIDKDSLGKVLRGVRGCSKPIANYITYLNERSKGTKFYKDEMINKYFDYKERN